MKIEIIQTVRKGLILMCFGLLLSTVQAQLYFPPKSTDFWDTMHYSRLGWCANRIDSMYDFLEEKNTRAFVVLKDGKIVLEKYFGSFAKDSLWYWASAGKSLAASVVGIAEYQGYLKLEDPVSKYLGKGWTTCPAEKEDLITIRHQITMSTGLNENLTNSDCTDPACLTYKADAGTRWFYHNAPYTLTHDVVEAATGKTFNTYTYQNLSSKIGMGGLWFKQGWNDIYFSKARDMARYGLLVLGKGIWQGDTVLKNRTFVSDMSQSSQNLNKSYGYLWWLNGKGQVIFPGLPTVFNRDLIESAPKDLFAGLGKNDQKLYIVPSQNLVVVRLGDAADQELPALSDFDNELWEIISELNCNTGSAGRIHSDAKVFPSPFNEYLEIETETGTRWSIVDLQGKVLMEGTTTGGVIRPETAHLAKGIYILRTTKEGKSSLTKIIKG